MYGGFREVHKTQTKMKSLMEVSFLINGLRSEGKVFMTELVVHEFL